jgi:hypothetical protein
MGPGFAQFLAFSQDAADNRTFLAQGKLQMPVLAFGGEATFGPLIGEVIRCVADNVEDAIIPDCGALDHGRAAAGDDRPGRRLPAPGALKAQRHPVDRRTHHQGVPGLERRVAGVDAEQVARVRRVRRVRATAIGNALRR